MRRPTIRSLAGGAAGIAAGVLGGIALTSVSAGRVALPLAPDGVDAAHLPPVLTVLGQPITLRYAIVCAPRGDGEPCDGSGEVFVRPGQSGPFQRLPLRRGEDSKDGRYFTDVPPEIASSRDGFSYYAVLRDEATGASMTLPAGGAAAPQRSYPLRDPVDIDLGTQSFGHVRLPDHRVVTASWGSRLGEVGLSGSRGLGFVGPSAFDVGAKGEVIVLDEVNGRVEHWSGGRPTATPVDISGGLADLAVEPDGTIDVLEPPNRETPAPVLRSFRKDGAPKWAQALSDRTWSKLDAGTDGLAVQQQPSEQWLPASDHGVPVDRAAQRQRGRPGRPLAHGHELIVDRVGSSELRLAELAGNAIVRAWRISSSTPVGEVQLAEPDRNGLVVVMKAYTDDRDEFVVLVLDQSGIAERFSVPSTQWAESAPLARFRLEGSSLYQLGSTAAGAFVDRYDLEVPR
jgi:hypothetical protein